MEAQTMIGTFRFRQPGRDRWVEAVLNNTGRWECTEIPCLTRVLDIRFGPAWHDVPADSAEGLNLFREAACWLNGTIIVEPMTDSGGRVLSVVGNPRR
jgi:hypothetical protein